jgi:hypothetical protein
MLMCVLVIVLILAMTTGLSQVGSPSRTAGTPDRTLVGPPRAATAVRQTTAFTTTPFRSPVIAPVTSPWMSATRSAAGTGG